MITKEWYIDICNPDGAVLQRVDNAGDVSFSYIRQGGCESLEFTILKEFLDFTNLQFENHIYLYLKNLKIFAGYISKFKSSLSNIEKMQITAYGFYRQLERVEIDKSYSNVDYTDIKQIVDDIMQQVIATSGIKIQYNSENIQEVNWMPDEIKFEKTNALDCMQKLAILAGAGGDSISGESLAWDWGVDENLNFYFKEKNLNETDHFSIGKNITLLEYEATADEIKNNIKIYGGVLTEGSNFFYEISDNESIARYGKRTKSITYDCIVTTYVAERYAQAFLKEFKIPVERGTLNIENIDKLIKPNGIMRLINIGRKYYELTFYPHQISYNITENLLSCNVSLGRPKTNLSNILKQIIWDVENNKRIEDKKDEDNNDLIKPDLIPNGSFEVLKSRRVPWGWTTIREFINGIFDVGVGSFDYQYAVGKKSFLIYYNVESELYYVENEKFIEIDISKSYTFGCKIMNKKGTNPNVIPAQVYLMQYDENHLGLGTLTKSICEVSEENYPNWKEFNITIEPSDWDINAKFVKVRISLSSRGPSSTGWGAFDSISLREAIDGGNSQV